MAFDLLGLRRRALRTARRIPDEAPRVDVEVRRGSHVKRFRQELLADGPRWKITLQILDADFQPVRIDEATTLRPGSLLMWFLRPGQPFEVGAFYHGRGTFQGYYINLIRPPRLQSSPWIIEDLYLDVWLPDGGSGVLLDEDELDAAVDRAELSAAEADEVRRIGAKLLARSRRSGRPRWLPRSVGRTPAEAVPALRLRRDAPGTFHAARISGRIIAFGLYLMAAVSATSAGFAAFTDAFLVAGPAQDAWRLTLLGEALLLAPLALGGWLPATRWPQPPLTDERYLFIATLASGLAVLGLSERTEWAGALLPVYATLGLFSLVFAVCRWWFDRKVPVFALAGAAMTLVALVILVAT
ncbi:MAG: DUF402 domain-containing protein [Gemmatimonadales bacterium]|nr:DUF402 domain-containing protein [Gemmatimonadales bacterium]MYC87483.1 DUF402 domain-containing protein [Candidatus Palauibacter denitrificans]